MLDGMFASSFGIPRAGRLQLPLSLSAPDESVSYRGVSTELDEHGLVFLSHSPVAWHGFEPLKLTLPCGSGPVEVLVHWEIRGHARVWRLDFVEGQEDKLAEYRALLSGAPQSGTGRTTRRVTEPRRDEATTIRRMLRRLVHQARAHESGLPERAV